MNNCFRIHIAFVSPCYYQDHTWSNADNDKACHNSVLVVDNWLTKLIQNNHCWLFTSSFWFITTFISLDYPYFPLDDLFQDFADRARRTGHAGRWQKMILTLKSHSLKTDFIHLKEKDIASMIFNYYMPQFAKDVNVLLKVKLSR